MMAFPYGVIIKNLMLARNYPWFPDQNVVTVETMNRDGSICTTGSNTFDDIKMVLDGNGNVIGGPWDATDHPGFYWTENPMATGGAFIIALGPQACWTPGQYHEMEVWRQAPDSTIMGHRDPNDTYKRQGPPIAHGDIGVHHHHGYNLPKSNISNAAAGCQVIRLDSDQDDFMRLTKQCPRYLANPTGYRLTATVLEAKDIMEVVPPTPVSVPVPIVVPTSSNFANCLALTLPFEGGNDDDSRDPGGRTSRGILQREWTTWRSTHPGLPSDVWQAPDDQIAAIYKQSYWDVMHCDALPKGIDYAVFDFGVNSGPSRSIKFLQFILGVHADGIAGNATIAAAKAADPKATVNALCDQRLSFLKGLSTWGTFGRGWTNRVVGVRKDALAMIGAPAVVVIPAPVSPVVPIPPTKVPGTMTFTINWKTTLAGLTAVIVGVGHILTQVTTGAWDWGTLITEGQAVIVGIGLIFAKDANVTGGTTVQPSA